MNCKEWHFLKSTHPEFLNWDYYNSAKKFQRSLKYNSDPNAKVIHHLRDTEEQRLYNDTYYERWGFNEDGTFEYGKYVIFVTEEWHSNYHAQSEETRKKISESNKLNYTEERKLKVSATHKGKHISEETRKKQSYAAKHRTPISEETRDKMRKNNARSMLGKKHSAETLKKISDALKGRVSPNKGKKASDETREKLSASHKGILQSDETKRKIGESNKSTWTAERKQKASEMFSGENNPNFGKQLTDEEKRHISDTQRKLWSDSLYRQRMRDAHTGYKASAETREKMSRAHKDAMEAITASYKEYKLNGGTMMWNEFQKYLKTLHSDKQEIIDG